MLYWHTVLIITVHIPLMFRSYPQRVSILEFKLDTRMRG